MAARGATIITLLRRLAELLVGVLALVIAALTLWVCYDVIAHPPDTDASRATLWALVYFLGFIALALALFGLRLIIPPLRVEGGHIIGIRALVAFTFLYAIIVVVGLIAGRATAATLGPPALIFLGAGSLLLERLQARSRQ